MLDLLPPKLPKTQPLPDVFPAKGRPRARVALLVGCVQSVLAPEINWATLRVLAENRVDTIIPKGQGCCGAIVMHMHRSSSTNWESTRPRACRNRFVRPITTPVICGSAGVYNLVQPEIARQLGQRKAARILETGAEAVVTGNIGCMTQIQSHLSRDGRPLPVYHTINLLDRAYRGEMNEPDK